MGDYIRKFRKDKGLLIIAPWVAIAVSIVALWIQIRRSRFSQSVELILKLEERFFNEEKMIEARKKAAKALIENRASPSSDIEDVLDFFETLGLLVRRHALDQEMVWHTLYHWIHRYCFLTKEYILEKQKTRSTVWKDFVALEKRLIYLEKKEGCATDFDINLGKEALDEFLEDESNL